jgi:two-component system sensor histidine kinase AtoS
MRNWRGRWSSLSLRAKLAGATILVLSLMMLAVIGVVERRQRETIIEEVQKRGVVLAKDLAAVSANPLLLYNYTALEQNVERFGLEADVVYAVVLDMEGKVAAWNRQPGRVGSALTGPVDLRAADATSLLVQETVGDGQAIYDIAVPILVESAPKKWGTVRIGLSKRRMELEIARTRWELVALAAVALVLGGAAATLVAGRIARPVRRLSEAAVAISGGDLNQRVDPETRDEIGQLALAFNHMASQLLRQRNELESAHAELRRRFEELSDLKGYTDNILNSITSGIITLDLDGRVVTLNPAAEHLTGLSAAEAAGKYFAEVFAHAPEVVEILIETLANRAGVAMASPKLRRPDDSEIPVEITTAPLTGAEGKDLGVVGIFRDLTAVRQLENQLRRADRLASLGTLAAGLAHEIKNPLTSFRTFTQLLPQKFGDTRFLETFQRVIPRELERINAIVEGLLDLARPIKLVFETVHVSDLLNRALELYADRIETKVITVVREFAPDVPPVKADPEHLYRVLVNLAANALDAMERGGRLTLRTAWAEPSDLMLSPCRSPETAWVKVEVEDTGSGIPPSAAAKIFTPFFTTKERGTGMGLATAYKIVEDHGGRITFRSTPGAGTTFTLLLPLAAELSHRSAR